MSCFRWGRICSHPNKTAQKQLAGCEVGDTSKGLPEKDNTVADSHFHKEIWRARVARGETTESYQTWLREFLRFRPVSITMTGEEWEELLGGRPSYDSFACILHDKAKEKCRGQLYK